MDSITESAREKVYGAVDAAKERSLMAAILAFLGSLKLGDLETLGRAQRGGLAGDTRAESFMDKGVNIAVGLLVVGLLTAYLLPIAINEIVGVDTTSWGSAEAELFSLLPLFFVLAILLFVVGKAMSAKK